MIFYGLIALTAISLISFLAALLVSTQHHRPKFVMSLVALAAGSLTSDALLHLFPEVVEGGVAPLKIGFGVLGGIVLFFIFEKFLYWRHCHIDPDEPGHVHPFAYSNLVGDLIHNVLDGMMIAAAFLAGLPVGIATAVAIALHEIPQELSDVGVMLHAGMSRKRTVVLNTLTAFSAFVGFFLVIIIQNSTSIDTGLILSLSIGGFLYIAVSDLIPELKHTSCGKDSLIQAIFLFLGVFVNILLLFLD